MELITPTGAIWNESRYVFLEKFSYLKQEAEYAINLCDYFSADQQNAAFYYKVRASANSILAHLNIAQKLEKELNQKRNMNTRIIYRESINAIFENLPALLNAITFSFLQRRQKGIHQFFSRNPEILHFSLSEIHLDFPKTFTGIENLVNWYHNALSPFWGRTDCAPPILTISNENIPAFVEAIETSLRLIKKTENMKLHYKYILDSTFITLPRWQPVQMRYLALLAHEIFHKVLFHCNMWQEAALFVKDKIDRLKNDPNSRKEKKMFNDLKESFSDEVYELCIVRGVLNELLINFFKTNGIPTADLKREWDEVLLRSIANDNVNEILADIAGMALCGPAYLYSMPDALHSNPDDNELLFLNPTMGNTPSHPPEYVRILFINILLNKLGFKKIAHRFYNEFGFGNTWKTISKSHPFFKKYFDFLTSDKMFNVIYSYALRLITMIKEETNCQPFIADSKIGPNESEWKDKWDKIIELVRRKEVYISDLRDFAPPDIINAIWQKVTRDNMRGGTSLRMGWRIALSNIK